MSSAAAQALGPLLRYLPYDTFNKVQEGVIPSLFADHRNCLIAAPTGSGKTVLLEVAMLRLFRHRLLDTPSERSSTKMTNSEQGENLESSSPSKYKAVYICPIKALASEKYDHWRRQFPSLAVVIETGDQMQQRRSSAEDSSSHTGNNSSATGAASAPDAAAEDMASVSQADILVTTPERWDSITRRWKEKEVMAIVHSVGLLLLDEVHTVQEERGAAMEAIVSRVKAIQGAAATARDAASRLCTRIVAISGTLPNVRDMAEWLGVCPAMTFAFAASDRPVPLTVRVISYAHDTSNPFAFHRFLSFKIFSLIQQYSEGKPTLVFCASRKEVTSSAARLVDDIHEAATRRGQLTQLQPSDEVRHLAQQANDKQLRTCLLSGVGFHHAAMTMDDRTLVERMFREQYIAVVCSTTTLALGVNLPAHLVLVKGTSFFANGQCQDMSVSEVLQMCGRAGRPGLDAHGVALVLTTQRRAHLYDTLRSGAVALTCVESHLHRNMIEHVNAEVALRTIQNFHTALEWVKTTFFWIRLQQCPRHYGLEFANKAEENAFDADAFVEALMERVLRVLVEEGCVVVSQTTCGGLLDAEGGGCPRSVGVDGEGEELDDSSASLEAEGDHVDIRQPRVVFEPTRLGRAMSRMYILFDTVCVLNTEMRRRGTAKSARQTEEESEEGLAAAAKDELDANEEGEEVGAAAAPTSAPAAETPAAGPSETPSPSFTLQETLRLLCQCQELVEVRLRQGDRGPLNELNRAVRFPLHSGRRGGREVREDWHKVYLLIQAHVGLLPVTEVSLRNDSQRLWSVVPRVSRFLEEYAWAQTPSYSLACTADVLARSVERRVWPDGLVLRQLQHVSDAVAKALARGGYSSFSSLRNADARQLEVVCSRLPPFGNQVLAQVRGLPQIQVELQVEVSESSADRRAAAPHRTTGTVRVYLCCTPDACFTHKEGDSTHATTLAATAAAGAAERHRGEQALDGAIRHGGKGARTASAMRDGRVLLVVGAPATDAVLLKRVVPLFPAATSLTGALQSGSRVEVAVFTFHIPPAVLVSPAGKDGRCRIEARCSVLHIVGLDAVAEINWDSRCASKGQAAQPFAATTLSAPPLSRQNQTLDSYFSSTAVTGAALNMEEKRTPSATSSTSITGEAVKADMPATVAAQIAAEARDSFNALLADMTYVASADKRRRQPAHAKERKRTRRETAEASEGVGVAETAEGAETPSAADDVEQRAVAEAAATLTKAATAASLEKPEKWEGSNEAEKHCAVMVSDTSPAAGVTGATSSPIQSTSQLIEAAAAASSVQRQQQQRIVSSPRTGQRGVERTTTNIDAEMLQRPVGTPSALQYVEPRCGAGPVRLPRCASPPAACPHQHPHSTSLPQRWPNMAAASGAAPMAYEGSYSTDQEVGGGYSTVVAQQRWLPSRGGVVEPPNRSHYFFNTNASIQPPRGGLGVQPSSASRASQARFFSDHSAPLQYRDMLGGYGDVGGGGADVNQSRDYPTHAGVARYGVAAPGSTRFHTPVHVPQPPATWPHPMLTNGAFGHASYMHQRTPTYPSPYGASMPPPLPGTPYELSCDATYYYAPPPSAYAPRWGQHGPAAAPQWPNQYAPTPPPAATSFHGQSPRSWSAMSRTMHAEAPSDSRAPPPRPPTRSEAPPLHSASGRAGSIDSAFAACVPYGPGAEQRRPSTAPLQHNGGSVVMTPSRAESRPAASGSYMPHVQRSAMVPRSWW